MFLVNAWYRGDFWLYLLWPLSLVFRVVSNLRRVWLQDGAQSLPLPVVVVGNIAVGGSGKTPMVIALARLLQERGLRPGIVSRGYGAATRDFPREISPDDDSEEVGDEALMLRRGLDCPLVIDPDRPRAVRRLSDGGGCDVIISDDGLQHYAMRRDLEIAMLDGRRGLGNGLCLPAGPLRESPARLAWVDRIVFAGEPEPALAAERERAGQSYGCLRLRPTAWVHLSSGRSVAPDQLPVAGQLHAVAGIGHPARFFETVEALGYTPECHAFADHHRYVPQDLAFGADATVVMTEKDAVKCADVAPDDSWYLRIEPELDEESAEFLVSSIQKLCRR